MIKNWSQFYESNSIDDELYQNIIDITRDFEEDYEFTCKIKKVEVNKVVTSIRVHIQDSLQRFYTLSDIQQYINTLKSYISEWKLSISVLTHPSGILNLDDFINEFVNEEFYDLNLIIH
jgi:hypothetical protein